MVATVQVEACQDQCLKKKKEIKDAKLETGERTAYYALSFMRKMHKFRIYMKLCL